MIDDFQMDFPVGLKDSNIRAGTAGIAVYVGETFLQDPEKSGFGIGGESHEIFIDVDVQLNAAALFETFEVPENGGSQAAFIQKRWM